MLRAMRRGILDGDRPNLLLNNFYYHSLSLLLLALGGLLDDDGRGNLLLGVGGAGAGVGGRSLLRLLLVLLRLLGLLGAPVVVAARLLQILCLEWFIVRADDCRTIYEDITY